jgi:hypothetical protein
MIADGGTKFSAHCNGDLDNQQRTITRGERKVKCKGRIWRNDRSLAIACRAWRTDRLVNQKSAAAGLFLVTFNRCGYTSRGYYVIEKAARRYNDITRASKVTG